MSNKKNINKSYKLSKIASEIIAGGVCHDVRFSQPHPIYIERGEGSYIWDIDGNKYIDYGMGNGSLLIGHSHIDVINAIETVLKKGYHFGEEHSTAVAWGEKIVELVNSVEKVRFVGSGTEAIMLASRIARAYTNKSKIIRIEGHFHGWSDVVGKGFLEPFDDPDTIMKYRLVTRETGTKAMTTLDSINPFPKTLITLDYFSLYEANKKASYDN